MDEEEEVIITWSSVWATGVVSTIQALIFYAFFLRQRGKDRDQGSVDLYEPRQHTRKHRSPEPFADSWWKSTYAVSQEELLRCVGLDSYMFLRVLRMAFRICCLGTLMAVILIPVYATGGNSGNKTKQFNLFTLAKVNQGSARLWAPLWAWWVFCAFVINEFWTEWKHYYDNRSAFLARGDQDMPRDSRYAVIVEQIPNKYRSDKAIYAYFDRMFPGKVQQATVFLETSELRKLMEERQENIEKLEKVVATTRAKPDQTQPTIKLDQKLGCCGGQEMDAVEYYQSEISRLNAEIDQDRSGFLSAMQAESVSKTADVYQQNSAAELEVSMSSKLDLDKTNSDENTEDSHGSGPRATSTAFVTFTSLRTKQAAIQCEMTGNPEKMVVSPAADPKAVLWDNVGTPLPRQKMLQFAAAIFFTVGILFWALPVAFITAIAKLNGILETFGLPTANPQAGWYGLVSGLLPVIFLAILMAVLYMLIVAAATNLIRYKSASEVDAYTLYWHQLFQFANLWLILIGGSAFDQLDTLINDPTQIIEVIATALPGVSLFFVNIMIVSLGACGMELSLLATYGVKLIMKLIQPEAMLTQRQLDEALVPPQLVWGKLVPPIVFIFLVIMVYMPIVPIMEVFGLLYFGGKYLVYKHQCLHVYAQQFEGGGEATWQRLFPFLIATLYMGQLIFIAYMGVKEGPIQAGLGFVPFIITVLFHRRLNRLIVQPLANLSMEAAADVDIADGELDQNASSALYGMPSLDASQEERGPMPYRRSGDEETGKAFLSQSSMPSEEA